MLFGVIDCIQSAIDNSNFPDLFMDKNVQDQKNMSLDATINYHNDFWKKFSESLLEAQRVFIKNIIQLSHHKVMVTTNLLNVKVFSNTSEYGIQNWSVNLIEPQFSFNDLWQFGCKGLEMSYYLQLSFFEIFEKNVDGVLKSFADDLGRNKRASKDILNEYMMRQTNNNAYSRKATISKSRVGLMDNDEDDMDDDRYYLNFIKKYYEN